MHTQLWTISELADGLGVTTRTIRFYEDKGLLNPQRIGANRVYSHRDRARLQLVLRGKRLGFSLTEIREYIELYDADMDPAQQEQLKYLLELVRTRRRELLRQQEDLQQMLHELNGIEAECLGHLHSAQSDAA